MKNIIFICQAVDKKDPLLSVTVNWIKEFSYRPEVDNLTVLTLRAGEFSLPDNVKIKVIKRSNRFFTLLVFYKEIIRRLRTTDLYFVHMGGPYPLLLMPFKLLGKKIYQWKTHSYISPLMKFQAHFCDNKIFTAAPSSFAMSLNKVKVIGHGIDTDLFRITSIEKQADLITAGRYSPVKDLDKILELIAKYNEVFKQSLITNFYGPTLENDQQFKNDLVNQKENLLLTNQVFFRESIKQDQLPSLLNQHKIFVSFNTGGLDKAVLEAMACGLPILTPNQCVAEILPDHLKTLLIVDKDDHDDQINKLNKLLTLTDQERSSLGEELRAIVRRGHTAALLVNKIFIEINNHEK